MPKSVNKQIIEGLQELRDALSSGEKITHKLTYREVTFNLRPTTYDPDLVRTTRKQLNVSQGVFADFIGVSLNTVRAWEQGENPVTGAPARLMDEIRENPEYWRSRVLQLATATQA